MYEFYSKHKRIASFFRIFASYFSLMTHRTSILYLLLLLLLYSCGQRRTTFSKAETETPITFKYARNIRIESEGEALKVSLTDPWNKGKTLHTYYLLPATAKAPGHTGQGTIVRIPLRRGVFFTTAHANLLEMLHAQSSIAGVGDARYMLIPDVQHRLRDARVRHPIADCGARWPRISKESLTCGLTASSSPRLKTAEDTENWTSWTSPS